jgi:hypothetical protein
MEMAITLAYYITATITAVIPVVKATGVLLFYIV